MTDITDQDRRAARQWAERVDAHLTPGERELLDEASAARVILATVDAPEPTLAEELARIAENSPVWTIQNVCDELKSAAARAEQMERDLEEARAAQMEHDIEELRAEATALAEDLAGAESEVERLTTERDRLQAQVQGLARRDGDHNSEVRMLTEERDEAHDEVERLTTDLKIAIDKVDHLTAERNRIATGRYVTYAEVDGKTVQKAAESDAETPNPADVKPGEAWMVECDGERRTAVKDREADVPWNTIDANGRHTYKSNENVALITRLVPAPRVITNADELDRAKRLTVIRDGVGVVCERAPLGDGWFTTGHGTYQIPYIELPATVLWEPGA